MARILVISLFVCLAVGLSYGDVQSPSEPQPIEVQQEAVAVDLSPSASDLDSSETLWGGYGWGGRGWGGGYGGGWGGGWGYGGGWGGGYGGGWGHRGYGHRGWGHRGYGHHGHRGWY